MDEKVEAALALEDRNWWEAKVCRPTGWHLIGWTGRNRATFNTKDGFTLSLYGSQAESLIKVLREVIVEERSRCLDICGAHARDDGTAQRIADDIRKGE